MSRHRNVRNLAAEDYYDDYGDDDYYDDEDYEEYDTSYVAPKKKAPPATKLAAKTTVSAKVAMAGPAANKKSGTGAAKATTTTTAAAAGVTKPPPGWGKPSAAAAAAPVASISVGGVAKPPPGWGKPAPAKGTTASSASAGISKPPPGWGKPDTAGTTTTTTTTLSDPSTLEATDASTAKKAPSSSTTTAPSNTNNNASSSAPQKQHQQQPYKPKPLPPFLQQRNAIPSQLSMVVLGHVDAGKSTMMGQLLLQTGQVSKRQAQKQNNNLAWLLDENQSERERGVTMEIGTKAFSTKNHQIVVLDAPGHADFIPTTITGAANADAAILVVDVVTGEFESGFMGGGQTKEHILLAKGLGVSQVILALNKLDVEGWKQDRYEYVKQLVWDYLVQQRFKPARIQCVPVSGLTGENVASQQEPMLREWYTGPTLLQAIDRFKPANRQLDKPLRFIVTDMYAEGKGVVARGRVVQGFVQVGDKVKVLPLGDNALISRLEHLQPPSEDDPNNAATAASRLSVAIAGDTVELVLANVDPMRVTVGNIVVDPTHLPPIAKRARVKILVMDDLVVPIIKGAQVLFHMHSIDVPAALTKLIAVLKPDGTTLKERPRALTSGSSAMVELSMSDNTKIVMDTFQECRALGRFVLRRGGDTIAVGVIEEIIS